MVDIWGNSTMRKDTVLFFSYCIFFVFFISCDKKNTQIFNENTVLKINNIPVSKAEYKLFLDEEKALTYNYFFQKYKIEKSNTFWKTKINNEAPITYLKEKANENLKKVKIIQDYASKVNLVKPFNFDTFLKDWQKDNETRTKKYKAGEVVYGPINTNSRDYYFYIQSNLEIRLKDKLNQTIFIPSDNELYTYFNKIKQQHFTYIDTINVEVLSFPYDTSKEREVSLKKANKAYSFAIENKSLQLASKQFKEVKYQQKKFYDDVQLYGEENLDRILEKFSSTLKEGEIKLLDPKSQMNSCFYVVKLLKPNTFRFRNFNDVRKEVTYFYKENKYQQLLDSLQRNAVLKFNQKVYNSLLID